MLNLPAVYNSIAQSILKPPLLGSPGSALSPTSSLYAPIGNRFLWWCTCEQASERGCAHLLTLSSTWSCPCSLLTAFDWRQQEPMGPTAVSELVSGGEKEPNCYRTQLSIYKRGGGKTSGRLDGNTYNMISSCSYQA